MATKGEQQKALDRAVGFFEECQDHHSALERIWNSRSNAYHAVLENQRDRASWQKRRGAPYAMHIVDSTLASMVEDRLRFKIRPKPQLWSLKDDPAAAMAAATEGAKANQELIDWQMRQMKFTRIQRAFLLQNAITGITVAKTYWADRTERRRRMVAETKPLLDENDAEIIDPATGQKVMYTEMVTRTSAETIYEGPMVDVVDVFDFFWPEHALDLGSARYVAHRVFLSKEELEQGFKDGGPYGPDNGGWTLQTVMKKIGDGGSEERGQRWSEPQKSSRSNEFEVVEVWDQHLKETITFVNRCALLGFKPFPFFHERTPFTVCTTQPDLFKMVGISQIEKIDALQTALWELTAQREANLALVNNAIVMFNPALEDADALEWYPGAMWPMEDPELVEMWSPNVIPAEISLGAEALLKGDMQNLASTFPFSSGAESQTVDQKTATGASIVSALAQRSIDMAKQPVYYAWEDIGQDMLVLNNQFITETQVISVLGLDDTEDFREIAPELLAAADYEYVQEAIPDALMKQEEQAKWQAAFQVFIQAAPVLLPLAQAGAAPMINMKAVVTEYLKSLGIEDTEAFFASQAPQAVLPGQGDPAAAGGEQTTGITGQQALDPTVAPGTQMSSSPVTNRQRVDAFVGGALGG